LIDYVIYLGNDAAYMYSYYRAVIESCPILKPLRTTADTRKSCIIKILSLSDWANENQPKSSMGSGKTAKRKTFGRVV